MFIGLFETLKRAGVPVSLRELLDLHAVVERGVVFPDMEAFYQVARTVMVKDERHFDRFDRAFAAWFKGLEDMDAAIEALIPDEWLRREFEKQLTDEEKAKIESLGGLEELIETFKKRLESKKSATRAAISGLVPAAPARLGLTATTQKAFASGRMAHATAALPRCGTSGAFGITMTRWSWAPAISKWPCGGCANSPAKGR